MDNRHAKFCLKILSRFGKIIRKPQGVKFFGAPCSNTISELWHLIIATFTTGHNFIQVLIMQLCRQIQNVSYHSPDVCTGCNYQSCSGNILLNFIIRLR